MDVILKQDVPNLGHADEIVTVKSGYGRNYLIPRKIATLATVQARKVHAENMRQKSHKEARIKEEATIMAGKLKDLKIQLGAKTSSTGKIFGSVNTIQLAEALGKQGITVDRKVITIEDHIKEVGEYKAVIKLHREVKVELPFTVVSE